MGLFEWVRRARRDQGRRAMIRALETAGVVPTPLGLCLSGAESRRIFVISNGELDCADRIARQASDRDLVVQFNGCRHFDSFQGSAAELIYFLHVRPVGGRIIGGDVLARRIGRNDFTQGQPVAIACHGSRFVSPDAIARANDQRLPLLDYDALIAESAAAIPARIIPSIGFTAVLLLLHINRLRVSCGLPAHQIVLAGFTGAYPHAVFVRHDFAFEQAYYEGRRDLFCVDQDAQVVPYRPADDRVRSNLRNMIPQGFDLMQADRSSLMSLLSKSAFHEGDTELSAELSRYALWFEPRHVGGNLRLLLDAEVAAEDRQDYSDAQVQVIVPQKPDGYRLMPLNGARRILEPVDFTVGMHVFDQRFGDHGTYSLRGPDTVRRVLILNHTVWLKPNAQHLGCRIVSERIEQELTARGFEIAGWANSLEGLNRILSSDPDLDFDTVVINGEGTLHHARPRAFEILMMGQALARRGKAVHLVNSLWEENPAHFLEPVRQFRSVTVRDRASAAALARADIKAGYVPDLSWSHPVPPAGSNGDGAGIRVQDNVLRDSCRLLAAAARKTTSPFFVMGRHLFEIQQEIMSGDDPLRLPKVLEPGDFQDAGCWISGRYHGTILALRHRQPVVALESNTAKLRQLAEEIDLPDILIGTPETGDAGRFWDSARRQLDSYPAGWMARVDAFEDLARRSAAEMFDRIAD